jgi:transglutaminase-like putative cysteine protease
MCEDPGVLTLREGFYDEMVDAGGTPRAYAQTLVSALQALGPDQLAAAGRRRDAIFMQQGITFDAAGPDADGPIRDRPFPLDLVPRIIPAAEWTSIKRGLAQRIRARVRTAPPDDPPEAPWAELDGVPYRAEAGEFLLPVGDEPDDLALDELVGLSRAETPLATVRRMVEVIPDRFEYRAGVTYVGSTVADLLAAGAGVCQDFAHLALLLLRRHGIAARYVSGYLWAPPSGDETADSAEVETHAWIEALVPGEREPIWVPADPTNRTLGGETHVKIGHGRNYGDVRPVKGVFRGGAGAELSASVKMQRTDGAPARA